MKKKSFRVMALILAMLLLSACGGTPQNQQNASSEANTAAEENGLRLPPEWARDAVIYEVNVRQYTPEGSFAAFAQHLPELKEMGVTTLWFMPIHPISQTRRSGRLGSYYSVSDYRGVNPEFGTADDFRSLVDEAHEMGFHVMLDWVANHTGWDCSWVKEHPDWYTQDEKGNVISPEGMGWPDVADLNYDNMEMRAEMIACMKYWVEEYDIDGFRCDYANGVPLAFWEAARQELEAVKPVLMLAEDNLVKDLLNYAFDFNYNWELYDALRSVANGTKQANVIKLYIPKNYPDGSYTLNFLDNHDKNSYEHTIVDAVGTDALPAMFSLIYTIPGAPLVYTGDEIGLDHAMAFMDHDPVNWSSGTGDYRALLSALAAIRAQHPALWCGNYGGEIEFTDLGNKNVLAFSREKDGDTVLCLYNFSKKEQTVDLSAFLDRSETVLLCGQGGEVWNTEAHPVADEALNGEVTLQPWTYWILTR